MKEISNYRSLSHGSCKVPASQLITPFRHFISMLHGLDFLLLYERKNFLFSLSHVIETLTTRLRFPIGFEEEVSRWLFQGKVDQERT